LSIHYTERLGETGLDRKTVRKYLERGLEAPVYGPREPEERLAENYHTYLVDRLAAWPGLSARRLHREIKAMGFEGAYSTLTEYLRLIRPATPRQFETPAGQQAQVDFAEFQVEFTSEPCITRKVWLFSMVLGSVLPQSDAGNGDALPHRCLRCDESVRSFRASLAGPGLQFSGQKSLATASSPILACSDRMISSSTSRGIQFAEQPRNRNTAYSIRCTPGICAPRSKPTSFRRTS